MPLIMILYYAISIYLIVLLVWNYLKEKKSINDLVLYLLVLLPLILRILRVK
jgi:hypothetical protein